MIVVCPIFFVFVFLICVFVFVLRCCDCFVVCAFVLFCHIDIYLVVFYECCIVLFVCCCCLFLCVCCPLMFVSLFCGRVCVCECVFVVFGVGVLCCSDLSCVFVCCFVCVVLCLFVIYVLV